MAADNSVLGALVFGGLVLLLLYFNRHMLTREKTEANGPMPFERKLFLALIVIVPLLLVGLYISSVGEKLRQMDVPGYTPQEEKSPSYRFQPSTREEGFKI